MSTGGWGFGRCINSKPFDEAQHKTCFPCRSAFAKEHDTSLCVVGSQMAVMPKANLTEFRSTNRSNRTRETQATAAVQKPTTREVIQKGVTQALAVTQEVLVGDGRFVIINPEMDMPTLVARPIDELEIAIAGVLTDANVW